MQTIERKSLKQAIANRKKFVQQVYDFAQELIQAKGTRTFSEMHSSNFHEMHEVEIEGFRFNTNTGINMYGQGFLKLTKIGTNEVLLVLSFYGNFNAFDDSTSMASEVSKFREDPEWQEKILDIIKNKRTYLQKMERKSQQVTKQHKVRHKIAEGDAKLVLEAKRLGINARI